MKVYVLMVSDSDCGAVLVGNEAYLSIEAARAARDRLKVSFVEELEVKE